MISENRQIGPKSLEHFGFSCGNGHNSESRKAAASMPCMVGFGSAEGCGHPETHADQHQLTGGESRREMPLDGTMLPANLSSGDVGDEVSSVEQILPLLTMLLGGAAATFDDQSGGSSDALPNTDIAQERTGQGDGSRTERTPSASDVDVDESAIISVDANGKDPKEIIKIEDFNAAATVKLGDKFLDIGRISSVDPEQVQRIAGEFQNLYETDKTFRDFIDNHAGDRFSVILTNDPSSEFLGMATLEGKGRMSLNMVDEVTSSPQRLRELIVHEVAHWGGLDEAGAERIESNFRNEQE